MKRTPLARGRALLRRTPLRRFTPLAARRPVVSDDEWLARAAVRLRSGGACEGCDMARAVDWAHRQGRAQGGRWAPGNGLDFCRYCHTWQHARPAAAAQLGWTVRRGQHYLTQPVKHGRHGWVLLDDTGGYRPVPPPDETGAADGS